MSIIDREMDMEMYEEKTAGIRRQLNDKILRAPLKHLDHGKPVSVSPFTSVMDAVHLMDLRKIGCVVVTDGNGVIVGIFTERDVMRRVVEKRVDPASVTVGELMTRKPECLTFNTTIGFALNKMAVQGFRHIPIVDDKSHPIGIISVRDIVSYLTEFFPEDVLNLPPSPENHSNHKEPDGA